MFLCKQPKPKREQRMDDAVIEAYLWWTNAFGLLFEQN